jgi:hypothetical protein
VTENEAILRSVRAVCRCSIICTFLVFGSISGCTGTVAWLLSR